MHKQRIIAGIEKVFEGYAKDEELREALAASNSPLQLFPKAFEQSYFLSKNGTYLRLYHDRYFPLPEPCSLREVAEFHWIYLHCTRFFKPNSFPPPANVKAMLDKDLGKRVEKLKKDYARHFDNECDKQAESRYVQHPEV